MLTHCAGETTKRTVMPGVIPSPKLLASLSKTEEVHRKTREEKGMLEPRRTPHRTLFSPVDNAHNPAIST